ncbi:RelA/SpoT domain-containing protein [Brachybacterium endophyticum]|uniref:RelA/SpoT domain-containing protein n=1 Tax=Brachybacterium endophyticum TaxID=2182385 RepID=UPI001404026F|nr:RelA/SpoT domain-containing protein [Brachybacterium endophyticum]
MKAGREGAKTVDMNTAEEVEQIYRRRRRVWVDALHQVNSWLERQCAAALDDAQDKHRLEVHEGRIKDERRATAKLLRKFDDDVGDPSSNDLETLIHDLAATKVLCKSTRDQELITQRLADEAARSGSGIRLAERPKHYAREPKPSGYRANHLIFEWDVAGERPAIVEVQIKTRLQDARGELTHENSYKPGSAIQKTPFHDEVALTMANLLAEVDRLADCVADDMEGAIDQANDQASTAPEELARVDLAVTDVVVVNTGPRYALAEDKNGERGLIRAVDVRDLVGESGMIDVDDYVRAEDRLRVAVVNDGEKRFYKPEALAPHSAASDE